MSIETNSFDIASHLNSEEDIREFLEEVAATGTNSDFLHALNTAARAKGMSKVAKETGLTRSSLYKSLSADANPHYRTISKIASTFGYHLTIVRH